MKNQRAMIIETKYNTGDGVLYDDGKKAIITGIEYTTKTGVNYELEGIIRADYVDLMNNGRLRAEITLKRIEQCKH